MQQKRSRWIYFGLILTLLALLGFSSLPIVTSIVQSQGALAQTKSTPVSNVSQQMLTQLESQAKGYQIVLEREPDNDTALKGLLDIRLKQGDIKAAIEPLEKLANLNNNLVEYTVLLAQAKQQISDFEGSAAAYRQILANNPLEPKALAGMAQLMLAQNRPEGAIGLLKDALQEATELHSKKENENESLDLTSIELLLGQVYAQQKRYAEAISIYDRAVSEDKGDFRPVLSKALVMQEQGKNPEAKSLLKTAFSLAPAIYKDQIEEMIKGVGNRE
jgi:tetratricopeptide (TPR) repeat protein